MPRKIRTPWLDRERGQPNWYICYYDADTRHVKRCSTGTSDRIEASEELAHFLLKRAATQKHTDKICRPERYTIATALRWYAQEKGAALASSTFVGYAIDNLMSFFKEKATVATITPQKMAEYEEQRSVKSSTVRRECVVLLAALNHAVKNGRLTSAPKFPLPKSSPHKDRYLTKEEIGWLLKGCAETHVRLFVLLALNTGARKGAVLDLQWPQVDLVNRLIYLNPPDREQTNKRRATVPINDVLMHALLQARERAKKDEEKRRQKTPPDITRPCPHVVCYHNQPVLNVKKGFSLACRRAKSLHAEEIAKQAKEDPARYGRNPPVPIDLTGVTPHTLRHTAGTLMAQAGVDIFMIAKMLGHTVAKTTELYAHHKPDYLLKAANVLASFTDEK